MFLSPLPQPVVIFLLFHTTSYPVVIMFLYSIAECGFLSAEPVSTCRWTEGILCSSHDMDGSDATAVRRNSLYVPVSLLSRFDSSLSFVAKFYMDMSPNPHRKGLTPRGGQRSGSVTDQRHRCNRLSVARC